MEKFISNFKQSNSNFKKLNVLTLTALLIALNIVLESFKIQISADLKISFSFLAMALIGFLFGPSVAIFAGFVSDILSFFLTPQMGSFFPGYTLNAMITGLIYGVGLYNQKLTITRTVIVKGLVNIIINIGLNSLWMSFFLGKAVYILMLERTLKNILLLPIEAILLFAVAKSTLAIYNRVKIGSNIKL